MPFVSHWKQGLIALLVFSIVTGCGRGSLTDDDSTPSAGKGEGQGFFNDDGNGNRMPTGEQLAENPVNFTNGLGQVLVARPQNNSSALNLIPRLVAVLAGVIAAVRYIFSRRTGTVITRWGASGEPAGLAAVGGSVVYSGFGFGSHYQHAGREPECVVEGDPSNQAADNASDGIFPLATGGDHLPSGIPTRKYIACSKIMVRSATTVIHGSDQCPNNWAKIYSGYELGGHQSHSGRTAAPICVDSNFDSSAAETGGSAAYIYGTNIRAAPVGSNYTAARYLKCAVCAQM